MAEPSWAIYSAACLRAASGAGPGLQHEAGLQNGEGGG